MHLSSMQASDDAINPHSKILLVPMEESQSNHTGRASRRFQSDEVGWLLNPKRCPKADRDTNKPIN